MDREDLEQQVLSEIIAEAMAPYEHLFSESGHAYLRDLLENAFATHPATAELLEQLLPARVVQESGAVVKDAADGPAAEQTTDTEKVS